MASLESFGDAIDADRHRLGLTASGPTTGLEALRDLAASAAAQKSLADFLHELPRLGQSYHRMWKHLTQTVSDLLTESDDNALEEELVHCSAYRIARRLVIQIEPTEHISPRYPALCAALEERVLPADARVDAAGVFRMVEELAQEWGPRGGAIDAAMLRNRLRARGVALRGDLPIRPAVVVRQHVEQPGTEMPTHELLELQRTVDKKPCTVASGRRLGRPIGEWDPHALEVRPAGPGMTHAGTAATPAMPGYVRRPHDEELEKAVRAAAAGRSRIVVLVGTSSTGKTRACWEAVQPLAKEGWRLWHPFDPTRAEAALEDLHRVGPKTVVWLNEAQHYLGDRAAGERIAAAVHRLLQSRERGPVLVLGTLWPRPWFHQFTALPDPGEEDAHSRVRELLSGHTVPVPETFGPEELAEAAALAESGDHLLGDALTRTHSSGRLTQDLAGVPELLRRYQHASPAAKALLEAAMDAHRLGVSPHLPQAFLTEAAPDYLTDTDYAQLTGSWVEAVNAAYTELAKPVHGKQAPLNRVVIRIPWRPPTPTAAITTAAEQAAGPQFRLADYLEQHGRTIRERLCPPASFWGAAHTHLTRPDDMSTLSQAAKDRHRLQVAQHLRLRAAELGDTGALHGVALMREQAGDREEAERLLRRAAVLGHMRALSRLALMGEAAGNREEAERLARRAADLGNTGALHGVALMREQAGDREGAERLARRAADLGNTSALSRLAEMRERTGDREGAERLARRAADLDNIRALSRLALMGEAAGDREGAERLARRAADLDNIRALSRVALMREEAGDREGAERLARQVADLGDTRTLSRVALMREEAGDREGAERLARQVADLGDTTQWYDLSKGKLLHRLWPYGLDPDGQPTPP
ncbi:hypothetical protein ACIRP3_44045 [Streptomyces sp. NPDC101209]|uniref:hypothetical protein n=1 Tax=Streptomyces sp. NPDC101209 TaxID=3366129 RepID=UPI0037FFE41A